MSIFDMLNESTLTAFVEPFTYKGFGGDVLLQGVFNVNIQSESIGGSGFGDRTYTLQLLQSVISINNIEVRRSVTVNAVDYQIIDIQNDTIGMATLILRRY